MDRLGYFAYLANSKVSPALSGRRAESRCSSIQNWQNVYVQIKNIYLS